MQKVKFIRSVRGCEVDVRAHTFKEAPTYTDLLDYITTVYGIDGQSRAITLKHEDSEGDIVTITTDADVKEALSDVQKTHQNAIRLHVHDRPKRHGCHAGRNTGPGRAHCHRNRAEHTGPQPHHGWAGPSFLFGPHVWQQVQTIIEDLVEGAPDDGAKAKPEKRTTESQGKGKGKASAAQPTEPTATTPTAQSEPEVQKEEEELEVSAATTPGSTGSSSAGADWEKVTVDESNEGSQSASASDSDLETKKNLLKDMGFDLSDDLSTKLITEMNGRIDLIVSALVKNNVI